MSETASEPMVEPAQTTATAIQSEKPPCDIHFYMQADQFSEYMMGQIPELQAIAIVPLWSINMTGIPSGRIRLRNEKPSYAGQLFQMMSKLAAFGVDVHRDLVAQIKTFNNDAGSMAQQLQATVTELAELKKQVEETKAELSRLQM